uniref:Uncharacterized protein n=1 Tax=Spongospora subterranea TaxID=70186 RepID=A0A0H5R6J8_9EUKA|eukprot:CRZ09755.1 hypothetical protein [Spongospora subterranea]
MASNMANWLAKLKRLWTVNPQSKPFLPDKMRTAPSSYAPPKIPKSAEALKYKIEYFPRDPTATPAAEITLDKTGQTVKGDPAALQISDESGPDLGYHGPKHLPRPEWMTNGEAAKMLNWCLKNDLPPRMGRRLPLKRSSGY